MTPKSEDQPDPDFISITNKQFGKIEVHKDKIINIIPGPVGFCHCHSFALLDNLLAIPFQALVCLEDPEMSFVVADPAQIVPGYQIDSLDKVMQDLGAETPEDLMVLVILTIPEGKPREMTANLLGPLVINRRSRQGKKVVQDKRNYSSRQRVFPEADS